MGLSWARKDNLLVGIGCLHLRCQKVYLSATDDGSFVELSAHSHFFPAGAKIAFCALSSTTPPSRVALRVPYNRVPIQQQNSDIAGGVKITEGERRAKLGAWHSLLMSRSPSPTV